MKKRLALVLSLVLGTALFTACGSAASSSTASSSQPEQSSSAASESGSAPVALQDVVYRGEIININEENGDIEVAQLPGFNYGSETVVFHTTDDTDLEPDDAVLELGMFVEVTYNGIMTRSIPPQATADKIEVISNMADSVIVNGEVQSVEKVDEYLQVAIIPLETLEAGAASGSNMENLVILTVEPDSLEGITVEELVQGVKVSAVTRGIATMSLPPQMPTVALMPYNWEA